MFSESKMAGVTGSELCGACGKVVDSEEGSIGCDGACDKWFHIKCVNISKKRFRQLCNNKNDKWYCETCEQAYLNSSMTNTPDDNSLKKPDTHTVLSEVLRKLGTLDAIVEEQQKTRAFFEHSVSALKEDLHSMRQELTKISNANVALNNKVVTLENNNKQITSEVARLKVENESLKQYTRINNLEIHGIPVVKNENPNDIVKNLGLALDIQINPSDIDVCHRLPTSKTELPPPLLVKFCSRRKKNELLLAKKTKKNPLMSVDLGINAATRPIYINEHLTELNKILYSKARELKKSGYKFVWTRDCKIFVRQHENARIHKIQMEEDIKKLTLHNQNANSG